MNNKSFKTKIMALHLILILFIIFFYENFAFADELDDLIKSSLSNASTMRKLNNIFKQTELNNKRTYLNLLPNIILTSGYEESFSASDFSSTLSMRTNITNLADNIRFSVIFSKDFADIDDTFQGFALSRNHLEIQKLQFEINKRNFIGKIIEDYANLCLFRKQIELKLTNLNNDKILLNIMNVKVKNGIEIPVNSQKLSNEILLKSEEINMDISSFEDYLTNFVRTIGIIPRQFSIDRELLNEYDNIEHNNQLVLDIQRDYLEITNNQININKKWRENFLPILSFSVSWNYDIKNSMNSYYIGIGLSLSILDYFKRENEIKYMELEIENKKIDISDAYYRLEKSLTYLEKNLSFMKKKIYMMEENIRISQSLIKLDQYKYEMDKISFHDFQQKQSELLSSELSLLQAKSKLYILQKKLQYGIIEEKP